MHARVAPALLRCRFLLLLIIILLLFLHAILDNQFA